MSNVFYKIAVDYPRYRQLTYQASDEQCYFPGQLVQIPLGKRVANGVIIERQSPPDKEENNAPIEYKSIIAPFIQVEFFLSETELSLYRWMADYYHYPLGALIFDSLPTILKRPRPVSILRGEGRPLDHLLNQQQEAIYQQNKVLLTHGQFAKSYIYGVTGSGKSSIFIHLLKDLFQQGKSALFLLPEINLTPQFTELFKQHLNVPILCFHSAITPSEKNTIWKFLKESDEPVLVMGVRSSIFLPVKNLGIIIVDEEHDSSFKQTDRCPYNARDVAIKKAQIHGVPIILASATPSVENYYAFFKTKNEKHFSFEMKNRASGQFPQIEIIDQRQKDPNKSEDESIWPLTQQSIDALEAALQRQEQALVFVNRLGHAQYLLCKACGYKFTDPNSDTPLRLFKKKNILASTISDYKIPIPQWCPTCGNMELLGKGFGTEKVLELLAQKFPGRKMARFDRDEITTHQELKDTLDKFLKKEIDILVGTQMLAKGHNFLGVNTVIILGIDSQLNYPDFRAMEKSYQLLKQISGRAGRKGTQSRVLIQTYSPQNELFEIISSHHFDQFYNHELHIRQMLQLPPFSRLAAIFLTSSKRQSILEDGQKLALGLRIFQSLEVIGPTPLVIEKRNNKLTWYLLLKSKEIKVLHQALYWVSQCEGLHSQIKIDVDPGTFF